jgi:hypothetical protein
MRRALAIALLIAFSSPLVVPLFAATRDPEASLPACCRRHGKHHCSMMMAMLATDRGPAFQAPPCPFYPTATTPPRLATASLSTSLPPVIGALRTSAPLAPTPRRAHGFTVSSNLKRGPPALPA